MTDTDTNDFTEDDIRSLQQLEQFMLDRGYRRDRHGFWRLPGAEEMLAIMYGEEDRQ